jgi:hypothetical protein
LFAGVSALLCVATVALIARSFVVADAVIWANVTQDPMTTEALEYARQTGFEGNFIGHYRFRSVSVLRGVVSHRRYETQEVMSRWDEQYMRDQLNKPRRERHAIPAADAARGYEPTGALGWLGFGVRTVRPGGNWKAKTTDITFPLWPIALASAAAPVVWARRALRLWRRRRGGLCLACGYDLRGLEDRRCPECGLLPRQPLAVAPA